MDGCSYRSSRPLRSKTRSGHGAVRRVTAERWHPQLRRQTACGLPERGARWAGAAVWFDAGGILRGGRTGLRNRSADSGGATGERPWREPPACVAADLSHTSSMGSGYRDGIGARMDGGMGGTVRRHLGAHHRGRLAQLRRDLPARRPALQHPLDRVPLVPREPSVGPRDRPCGAAFLLSGHAVLRSPGAGRSGPQGIGFPHSSAHVRMNVGGVRIKSIIKAYDSTTISCNLYGDIKSYVIIYLRKQRAT